MREPKDTPPPSASVYEPPVGDDAPSDAIARLQAQLSRAEDRSAWIQEICAALGSHTRQDDLLSYIMDRIALIMNAERATLFMREADTGYLYSRVVAHDGMTEVRVAPGTGVAGWVAHHGKSLNLRDAYQDPRFAPEHDYQTGFRTRSLLCQPMRDPDGNIIGVAQVLNKRVGWFTVEDEALLSAITNTAAIVIHNQELYLASRDQNMRLEGTRRQLEQQVRRLDTLHAIHKRVAEADDLDDAIAVVARTLADTVVSYGCAVTLVEGSRLVEYAWARRSRGEEFAPSRRTWDPSIRALVMDNGEPVRRAMSPTRPDAAAVTGRLPSLGSLPVTSVAAVPLTVEGERFGCVELVNRARDTDDERDFPEYDDDDLKLMDLVAGEISRAVARSLERKRREMNGRLSAIGQMLSGVIHDSRTPLAIASGYVQLMARSDDPARRRDLAAKVAQQFAQMNEMTRELLAYARGETTLYLRNVHLHTLVDEIRELLEMECAETEVRVEVRSADRGDVRVDDGKLKRVVFNLARNARDAMPGGGRLTVEFSRDGDVLVVRVADTGGGIPPEIQAHVFDAFVTSGKVGGSGLGLAVVKKLVEEHGGTIAFSSTSFGTTFTVRVPAGSAPADAASAT
ncbi:MAG: GAF domain-containing protein [Myxococcales bacterium]|nr:GAF domain-containing protein [Myxococcales bacterium]MCB9519610.1 GAF domain-containing protein [Myxococcales bacterium]MCB9530663.1 GAF domain-containing protein [Myxococcales bacterium]MCB9533584.1 GAF domain-containing protein [Myxococcales bacterium]